MGDTLAIVMTAFVLVAGADTAGETVHGAEGLVLGPQASMRKKLFRATDFEAQINFRPVDFSRADQLTAQEGMMTILSAAVFLKSATDTQAANEGFTQLGFEVQTISPGVLLLIAGEPVFEKAFGNKIEVDDTGAHVMWGDNRRRKLQHDALPQALRGYVKEVAFEAPPDFGPANF